MLSKIKKLYKSVAIITLTTIVLLLLVNTFFVCLAKIRWKYLHQFNPVYARYGDALSIVYPDMSKKEMHQLLAETWGRRYKYQQYLQFAERQYAGKYVNISKYGFRYSKNQGPWPPDPINYNIFIFGGSTTFNYGVPDNQTIASYLQECLNTIPFKNDVKVYNFGAGHYSSSQERILFEKLLTESININMAIFIDGTNESGKGSLLLTGRLSRYFDRKGLLYELIEETATMRALLVMKHYIATHFRSNNKIESNDSENINVLNNACEIKASNDSISMYLVNKKIIESVATEYGVDTLFIWQPQPSYKYDIQYHPFAAANNSKLMINLSNLYRCAKQRLYESGMGNGFFWMADMQENVKKPLYVDQVHYTAEMSRMMASAIYETLLKRNMLGIKDTLNK